jgi:elongation of very long chain fatty acids protein 4
MSSTWSTIDASIVGFFNPLAKDPAVRACVRNQWPLHRLEQAVALSACYVAFVVVCKLLLDKGSKGVGAGAERKGKASVGDKIKKDGIVVFTAMVIYNATQVALCAWMVYAALVEHRRRQFSFVCNVHNLSEDGMAFVNHVFYLSKVLDFADTVFMIVKGNWRQVSFLHVYHHASVFLVYWLNANTNYDGDIYFTIVLNAGIHFIMYGYYLASTFNIAVPVFIKKSITNAQLVQFCCMEAQGAYMLFNGCESPSRMTCLYMAYVFTMLVLFMDFKRRTYTSAGRKTE